MDNYFLRVVKLGKRTKTSIDNNKNAKEKFELSSNDKLLIKEAIVEAYKEIEKNKNCGRDSSEFLKFPMDGILYVLTSIFAFLTLVFGIGVLYVPITMGFNLTNIITMIISFIATLFFLLFTMLTWRARKEFIKETDKNYVVAFFSAFTSLLAIVIALISIIK
jgi:hypothetical protein